LLRIVRFEISEEDKRNKMNTSVDQFAVIVRQAIPIWAAGDKAQVQGSGEVVAKTEAQQAAIDELLLKYVKAVGKEEEEPEDPEEAEKGRGKKECAETKKSAESQKEETDTMKIDKSKMSPEELAAFEAIEKKYGVADPAPAPTTPAATPPGDGLAKGAEGTPPAATTTPELHPEVRKALDDAAAVRKAQDAKIEELTKSLEIEKLTAVAKKYEMVGKKADELAAKLYELKKAGGTHYADTIALLDEQVTLVEKSGLFSEIGTTRSGGVTGTGAELSVKAAEVQKANAGMTSPEAIVKAFEENPEMAAQYDAEYVKGRV
jgi:hypothetical protein